MKEKRLRRLINWIESDRTVLGILMIVGIGSSVLSLLVTRGNDWRSSWLQNFSTEMFGALLTFYLLEKVVGTRSEKERLIRQLRSRDHQFGLLAVEELKERGWLRDGSLQESDLMGVNLHEADLAFADLQESRLYRANLQKADLLRAELQEADMAFADLKGANFWDANLKGTNLREASLRDLQNISMATFDELTTLPNGDKWSDGYDLTVFTDPSHPDFWEPDWVKEQSKQASEQNAD